MAQRNEGSVSPGTRSPRSESPVHANRSAAVRPSSLRTALNAEGPSETSPDLPSPIEQYITGIPQDDLTPPSPNRPTTVAYPQRQSTLKQDAGPPNSFPNEAVATSAGASTPPGRRSVQFARPDPAVEHTGHNNTDSLGNEDGEPSKDRRGQSLMSKLKALASTGGLQTHIRSQSNTANSIDENTGSTSMSPTADRSSRFPHTLQEEGSDVDADAEETADEAAADAARVKRKRRIRRPQVSTGRSQTAPNTPRAKNMAQAGFPGWQ